MTINQPYHFMAKMFSPLIVWDTSRLSVAQKMTDTERTAIARRSTNILRETMPEIMQSFINYDSVRSNFADITLLNLMERADMMNEKDAAKLPKQLFNAEKSVKDMDEITQKYRAQAGYRAACLSCLIKDDKTLAEADDSFQQLHQLGKSQQSVFQALLLQDLLRLINKFVQIYPTFDFDTLSNIYVNKLKRQTSSLRKNIESMETLLGGVTAVEFVSNLRSRNAVFVDESLNDPVSGLIGEFEDLLVCFKKLNETLSTSIATCIEKTQSDSNYWSLNLLDES